MHQWTRTNFVHANFASLYLDGQRILSGDVLLVDDAPSVAGCAFLSRVLREVNCVIITTGIQRTDVTCSYM